MNDFWQERFNPSSLRRKKECIIGILNPIMWDKRGRIKKFSIYSQDEDIIIEGYKNRERLKNLLNKKVEAKGQVTINEDGEKFIRLDKIRELEGPNSPAMNIYPASAWMLNEEYSVCIPTDYALSQYENLRNEYLKAS
jgi:hypothetical protein